MSSTLIVARHGNTFESGDTLLRVGARTDLALSNSGCKQARALGLHLKSNNLFPDEVYTSLLLRTKQTAEIALDVMDKKVFIQSLAELNEVDYGADDGQPEDQVLKRVGKSAMKKWEEKAILPEGWRLNIDETVTFWKDLAEHCLRRYDDKVILVVTSNGVARFAPHITGDFEGFRKAHPLKLSTGAYGVFKSTDAGWVCDGWNIKP